MPRWPRAEEGEVVLRGPSVMAGYLDDPEGTAWVLSPDGWLRTGDIGVVDAAGRLHIVGRVKDMFIVGGFNAYPAEIENTLLRHPAIRQAAVIGVPDGRLGEVGMAFVVTVRRSPSPATTSSPGPGTRWPTTRCRAWSRSSTSSRRTRRARWSRTCCGSGRRRARRELAGMSGADAPGLAALADLRVVELGVWVAAPSAAALLADWGVDVIKVEQPSGDPMRHAFGYLLSTATVTGISRTSNS